MTIEENKSIRLVNQIAVAMIPALFLMTVVVTVIQKGNNPLLYLQPINILLCFFVLWLNYKHFINLSRFVFCVFPALNILGFSIITKLNGLTNNLAFALMPRAGLLICIVMPVLFFGYARRRLLLLAMLPSVLVFLGFDTIHKLFGIDLANLPYHPQDYFLIRSSYLIALLVLVPAILTLQRANLEYEQALNKSKEEIEAQRDDLNIKTQLLHESNQDLTASITYAKRIQNAMLLTESQIKQMLPNSFVLFSPRDIVSGDFYYCTQFQNQTTDKIILAALDCTGHGVPGAFMSMVGNEILNEVILTRQLHTPNLILAALHKGVQQALKQKETNNQDGMDVALVALTKNPNDPNQFTTIEYAGAMNPLYLFCQQAKEDNLQFEFIEIKATKRPIGGFAGEDERNYTNHVIDLVAKNYQTCRIYLCSDGYQDQFGGEKGQKFLSKRFKELLATMQTNSFANHKQILATTLHHWTTHPKTVEQIDDILVMGVELI